MPDDGWWEEGGGRREEGGGRREEGGGRREEGGGRREEGGGRREEGGGRREEGGGRREEGGGRRENWGIFAHVGTVFLEGHNRVCKRWLGESRDFVTPSVVTMWSHGEEGPGVFLIRIALQYPKL